jgi:hypothetical protein
MFRDKRMLIGIAGAAGIGLIVLVMRSRRGGGEGEPQGAEGGTTTLQPGTYDSTGTDIYNGLQALYGGTDARFNEIIELLKDKPQDKLPSTPPTSPNTGPLPPFLGFKRKAQPTNTSAISIKSLKTAPGSVGRWSWENLIPQFYDTRGASRAQIQAAARRLAAANAWRYSGSRKLPGYTAYTVPGLAPITVPTSLGLW